MADEYHLYDRVATPAEYRAICDAVGWAAVMNFDAAPAALRRSLFGVVATRAGAAVGMGRVVGDGAIFFYLQDIAVVPGHQHRGVGRMIMARLIDYLALAAPDRAFVGLFAAEGSGSFYERYGFRAYPALTGMFQVAPLTDD
ncbi:MAG: GNAT family N-acetyltransferase [Kouleothrix sp.]|nr:GNAT family N-acetyltransferase [Kouleothrix sp.]